MTDLSYITLVANDGDLQERVAAQAALLGVTDPVGWAAQNRWKVAAFGTIAGSYEYAKAQETINVNPRTGQRTDTITDTVILDAVETILADETT